MNASPTSSFLFRALLGIAIPAAAALAQPNPNLVLRMPDIVAQPGSSVVIPVWFDNNLADVQGWQFSCNVPAPLDITGELMGGTALSFNQGVGPDFISAQIYQGQGYTVGCVISFFGIEFVGLGTDHHLHNCMVDIPSTVAPGTVIPLDFGNPQLGNPLISTVIVINGQSYEPTVIPGSITVGSPATVTQPFASDCPVMLGDLVSINTPSLGATWEFQMQSTPAATTHGFYVIGLALQPIPMFAFGSPCTLQVNAALTSFRLAAGGAVQSKSLIIPTTPSLMGSTIYVQGLHDGAPQPPFSPFLGLPSAYYFTNTIAGTIGL